MAGPKINTCDPKTAAILAAGAVCAEDQPNNCYGRYLEHAKKILPHFCDKGSLSVEQSIFLTSSGPDNTQWLKIQPPAQEWARREYDSVKRSLRVDYNHQDYEQVAVLMRDAAKLAGIEDGQVTRDLREISHEKFLLELSNYFDEYRRTMAGMTAMSVDAVWYTAHHVPLRMKLFLVAERSGVSAQEVTKILDDNGASERSFYEVQYRTSRGAAILYANAGCFVYADTQINFMFDAAKALGRPQGEFEQLETQIDEIKTRVPEKRPDEDRGQILECFIKDGVVDSRLRIPRNRGE